MITSYIEDMRPLVSNLIGEVISFLHMRLALQMLEETIGGVAYSVHVFSVLSCADSTRGGVST